MKTSGLDVCKDSIKFSITHKRIKISGQPHQNYQ
jgi:hypothetical protein